MNNFEDFKSAYERLSDSGAVKAVSDKEMFLLYLEAEYQYPSLKKYWENEKVYYSPYKF